MIAERFKGRWPWMQVLAVTAVYVLCWPQAFADGRVQVDFELQSLPFLDVLRADSVDALEERTRLEVKSQLEARYPFLSWEERRPAAVSADAPRPTLRVIVSDSGPSSCSETGAVVLHWMIGREPEFDRLANVPGDILYADCDPNMPTQEPARLFDRLRDAITAAMRSDVFELALTEQLLSQVPIASSLLHSNHRLLLPMTRDRLNAGFDSLLRARFQYRPTGSETRTTGEMKMRPFDEIDSNIGLLVTLVQIPSRPIELPRDGGFWHDEFAAVASGDTAMFVFMDHYVAPSLVVSDLFLDP